MRNRFAQRSLNRPWFAALLFTAVLCRALIPAGFMPGPDGLVLCSGYASAATGSGQSETAPDMSGMDMSGMQMSGHSPSHESTGVCPFAAALSVVALVHVLPPMALWHRVTTAIVYPPEKTIPRGTIVPTSLPRGPPTVLA